jgi:rhodanese-related sulfurtransferase
MFSFLDKSKTNFINVNDLDKLIGKINLIDIREPYEYNRGHLPTTKNIPMDLILAKTDKYLDKSKEYYIICQSGGRSTRVCRELELRGYNVINVIGGTGSYVGPLER